MTKKKTWLLSLFIVLWVADTLLTMKFVTLHGFEAEYNPIPRYIMQNFGLIWFGVFKAVTIVPLLILRKRVHDLIYAGLIFIMMPVVYMCFNV